MNRLIFVACLLWSSITVGDPLPDDDLEIPTVGDRDLDVSALPSDDDSPKAAPASDWYTEKATGSQSKDGPPLLVLDVPVHLERLAPEVDTAWIICHVQGKVGEEVGRVGLEQRRLIPLSDAGFEGIVQFEFRIANFVEANSQIPTKPSHLHRYSCALHLCKEGYEPKRGGYTSYCSGCTKTKIRQEQYVQDYLRWCHADPTEEYLPYVHEDLWTSGDEE